MKGTALILVSAIAFASGNIIRVNQNGCPLDISTEKLMPHENCIKYYHCTHGDLVIKSCPKFLVFNELTQECDWPTNVDCGNRYISVDENTDTDNNEENGNDNGSGSGNGNVGNCDPSEAPALCAADGSNGVLVANEQCDRYYICSGGVPVSMKCPPGTLYNPHQEICDWPENVRCENRTIPEDKDSKEDKNDSTGEGDDKVCNCSPSEAPALCAADGSDGVFVANERCDKFYTCSRGKPVAMKCPRGTLYNPHQEICDWPENVKCEDRTVPDSNESEENKESENGNGNDNGNGSENGDNNGSGNGSEGNCDPSEAPALCAADGSDGVFVANERCDKFYTCSGGKPVAMKCPRGTLYNPHQEICDWSENVKCEDRTVPDDNESKEDKDDSTEDGNDKVCNCSPSEAPALCAADGSDGVFVANERCDKFYTCSGGKPVAMKCPRGTLYNPHQESCDWPENVQCDNRTIPEDKDIEEDKGNSTEEDNDKVCNCSPSEAPALCAADSSDGVLVANERCDKFYTCSGGKPVAMKCPRGTLYNPHQEICDWPENVKCENRTVPDGNESEENKESENGSGNENGDNNGNGNENGGNCDPSEAPALCAAEGSDGVFVANERCDKFYTCSGGKPVAMKCPRGTLYNPHQEICDWPENVQCDNRTIPEDKDSKEDKDDSTEDGNDKVCNCSPGEAPVLCAADGSDGVFVANERCDKFYTCSGGKPVAMKCPRGTLYNPHQEICDWPENVKCEDRTVPDGNESEENKESENGNGNENGDNNDSGNESGGNCDPSEAPALCAADGSDGVLVANERCDKFYTCSGGKPVAMKCPRGTLYNPHQEICDWPENVQCDNRTIPEDKDSKEDKDDSTEDGNDKVCNCSPSEAPALCAADGSDGVFVANERCDKFYTCSGGKPVAMKCPRGTLYNPHQEICDWPENVQCDNRTTPEDKDSKEDKDDSTEDGNDKVCNCSPSEAPALCAADGSDGVFVANERCDKFYTCSGGKPVAMKCPRGTLYNPQQESCDWPENVRCENRTLPDGNDSEENKESENGNGNENGDNNDSGNESGGNCDPSEAPALCAAEGSDGVFVANERCDKFYTCSGGKPVAMKCPRGTLYNPHQEICDWPENVRCENRTIPEDKDSKEDKDDSTEDGNDKVCNCSPSEAPALCAADGSDGVFVANERCDKFYTCSGGKPVAMKCPRGTLYNPHQEICDWPENVRCENRTIPEDKDSKEDKDDSTEDGNDKVCNCSPSEAPALCAADGSDGVFVANERCDKFYTCSGGKPVAMKCPRGTLYNPHQEICDWPENVRCENRTIPEDKDSKEDKDDSTDDGNDKVCNCSPSEAPVLCAADGSDGVFVANERCDKFYTCSGGKPVAMKCPRGTLYNPHQESCDWPENVKCEDRTVPDDNESEENKGSENGNGNENGDNNGNGNGSGGNCDPSEAPALCAADGSDGVLVANEQCDRFYKCSGGVPVSMKCPPGTLYNPHQEFCDWQENVQCEDRILSDDKDSKEDDSSEDGDDKVCNCRPGDAPALCAAASSDGTLVAHEQCNKFYICSGGAPVTMTCPVGLLYNPYLEYCDWPFKVHCGGRNIADVL